MGHSLPFQRLFSQRIGYQSSRQNDFPELAVAKPAVLLLRANLNCRGIVFGCFVFISLTCDAKVVAMGMNNHCTPLLSSIVVHGSTALCQCIFSTSLPLLNFLVTPTQII